MQTMKLKSLGVAVMRVQVDELHAGHRFLLDSMSAIHEKVLVVLGDTEARLSPADPLPAEARRALVQRSYPDVTVTFIADQPSDVEWSKTLDMVVDMFQIACGTMGPSVLYGSRDSFLDHYHGKLPMTRLASPASASGTEVRAGIELEDDPAFRRGMIFASKYKYPTVFPTVDVAIMRDGKVLLGRKQRDGGKWRFIGGFVAPSDTSMAQAALREAREETGLEVGDPDYIGSCQIDDYRYPKTGSDRIMTSFFSVRYLFGAAVAADDISEVEWFPAASLPPLVEAHWPLGLMYVTHFYGAARR